ncbi:ArgS-related anticodon-binding protein NrtL [Streptomyces sp. NPDC058466]|uniref:ArgS-related anticodon-binding protein NrtL n=1 Tax=Streptomyces sp. NPDC058466 TaxID=3346512 RepID=UPI00364C716E
MTPVELSRTVLSAVRRAVDGGELSVAVPARAVVTLPGPGGCGDYATNIALQLARPAGLPPREVAEILRPHLSGAVGVADVAITGPGFLNIRLGGGASAALVRDVLTRGPRYGHSDTLAGQVVELRVPYDARAEVIADALVRIVATQGGRAEVRHAEPVNLRPVPAPEDPAPLGPDAARWALLHPAPHDRPRITADHLVQRESNPLFRVRYAHARTRALSRNAAALGQDSDPSDVRGPSDVRDPSDVRRPNDTLSPSAARRPSDVRDPSDIRDLSHVRDPSDMRDPSDVRDPSNLHGPSAVRDPSDLHGPSAGHPEGDLLAALAEYPHVLRLAATHRAPDRLARHLVGTADALLGFQHTVLPRGDEKPSAAHRARLALAEAAGTVLAGGLSLLGISAPDYL